MKITLATIKSFIKKNDGNIFIKNIMDFDGMIDGLVKIKDNFSLAKKSREEYLKEIDLGISGAWFVGANRDRFSVYEDDIFSGYKVNNSCGSFILAIKK